MLRIFTFLLICSSFCTTSAQNSILNPSDTLNVKRQTSVLIGQGIFTISALAALDQAWYSDYPKSDFHFKNDNSQWLQMDKAGHVYSSYHLSRFGAEALNWSGSSKKNQFIFGASFGFVFLSAVEVLDGFSQEWGASLGDVAANFAGSALYVSQELLWDEQRVIPKFSFQYTPYAAARPNVLGVSRAEQILKDYNGQTYWLSANISSFTKWQNFPKWLNVAVGYGAEGMVTADDKMVNTIFFDEKERTRQFYLSLDVDLSRIETKSTILRTLFSVFNTIKIPAPTFEINHRGQTRWKLLDF